MIDYDELLLELLVSCCRNIDVELDIGLLMSKSTKGDLNYFNETSNRCAWWYLKKGSEKGMRHFMNYYEGLVEKHERLMAERAVRITKRKVK